MLLSFLQIIIIIMILIIKNYESFASLEIGQYRLISNI
jgi:hypothetical protein